VSGRICEHVWDDAYVCTLCGGIKYASAPMWAACLKLKSGPRTVLLALWSFANWHTDTPPPICPENSTIRERCGGIKESTLREHLATLKALGWIRMHEGRKRSIDLAWVKPYPPESRGDTDGNPAPDGIPAPPEYQRPPDGISAGDHRNTSAIPPESRPPYTLDESCGSAFDGALQSTRTREDAADAAIDQAIAEVHDDRLARHREIVEQQAQLKAKRDREHAERQAQLEAERAVNRAKQQASPRSRLAAEYLAAVQAAGYAWVFELDKQRTGGKPSWVDDLAVAVVQLGLKPEQVTAVLKGWERETDELGGAVAAQAHQGKGKAMPTRSAVWWECWRGWLARQLGAALPEQRSGGSSRSSTPITCAPSRRPVPIFGADMEVDPRWPS
jgi:hypothetical protein